MDSFGRSARVAAVDLGASTGRVHAVEVGPHQLNVKEIYRFANVPLEVDEHLYWNARALYREVLEGLRRTDQVDSIGVDSWAVDYGLLDAEGELLGDPLHYRDRGSDGTRDAFVAEHGADDLYRKTGIALLPFNTIFQLIATKQSSLRRSARSLLLMADLFAYWLTGERVIELTNASTTQLLDVSTRSWSPTLLAFAGIGPEQLPELVAPGTLIGTLQAAVVDQTGLDPVTPVIAVGSHDTASAVVAVPMHAEHAAYISCGTWSLVGVELDTAVLTAEAREARFTNELGVDGTIRLLRNVMGLWPLQEAMRRWREREPALDLGELLVAAQDEPSLRCVIDPDDPAFLLPGDLPGRIRRYCRQSGQPEPGTPAAVVRCILDSLALAHMRAVRAVRQVSGRQVDVVHLVGGGARNSLLCQLTADACGVPLVAGPVEASALGNALVQARALGAVSGGLAELRGLVAATQPTVRYEPRRELGRWLSAEARLEEVAG